MDNKQQQDNDNNNTVDRNIPDVKIGDIIPILSEAFWNFIIHKINRADKLEVKYPLQLKTSSNNKLLTLATNYTGSGTSNSTTGSVVNNYYSSSCNCFYA